MYYFLLCFIILSVLCSIFFFYRKKGIIRKVQSMPKTEKCTLLDTLAEPFGYRYHCNCGFFSSTLNAWQKEAGYTFFYDYMAPRFQMVYDSLPVYFDYDGKTWLIQFWKGQYGINTGAEIGIYQADHILSPEEYKTALFTGVPEKEMLLLSLQLLHHDKYTHISQEHWWLTSFWVGYFTQPQELSTTNTIVFPNTEMLHSFTEALLETGITSDKISISGLQLSFQYNSTNSGQHNIFTCFWKKHSQWKNQFFCKLYLFFTKPFQNTEDRILYLYYFLPFAFRQLLRLHRFDKRCHRKKRCLKAK